MGIEYFTGYDIGSEFVHSATLDNKNKLVYAPKSRMHFGNPEKCLRELVSENKANGIQENNTALAFTGNGGKVFAEAADISFFYDTLTIPLGAHFLDSKASYVFHIGAKDPYFFEKIGMNNGGSNVYIPDNSSGTKCGGGSGMLLTKQCRRLFETEVYPNLEPQKRLERMYELAYETALRADKEIDVGGRCGVVIQSDMIHLQNKGEKIENILRGLFERIARNYQADVVRIRKLDSDESAVITGGIGFNNYILKMLGKHLGVEIYRPEHAEKVGAIGAALRVKHSGLENTLNLNKINRAISIQRGRIQYTFPLSDFVDLINSFPDLESEKSGDLRIFESGNFGNKKIPVVMGVDGGSTTTKAFILRQDLKPVAEICIETHGKPLESAQNMFSQLRNYFGDKLDINAVAYTGSSGAFYHQLFTQPLSNGKVCIDCVVDEISCHAKGVRHFDNRVDTIFELGGQDAKFTLFSNGDGRKKNSRSVVKKAKMNLSCMAGTGQTMHNMINMVGLDFQEFEEAALNAGKVPIVDDTCGVFTEAGILNLVSLGLPREEVAAAIAYGFLGGYVNKFVGNEKFGKFVSAQGGPFKNKACLAAIASHTGLEINAFPHRQLFGAYGAALIANDKLKGVEE